MFDPDFDELVSGTSSFSEQETSVSTSEETLLFPNPVGGVNRADPDDQPVRKRNVKFGTSLFPLKQITPEMVYIIIQYIILLVYLTLSICC